MPATLNPSRFLLLASLLVLVACAIGMPSGQPGGRMARFSPTDRDPVGFLVLNRDSIGLPDSVVQRLVQLNLRLFRRNQALQNQIDSMMRNVHFDARSQRPDSAAIPTEVREAAEPLRALIHTQTAAAKDTAWAWLTDAQRTKADSVEARQAVIMRRGRPEQSGGREPGRP